MALFREKTNDGQISLNIWEMKKKSLFKNKTKIHHLKSLNELDKIILFFSGQTNFPMFLTTKKIMNRIGLHKRWTNYMKKAECAHLYPNHVN